MRRPLLIAVVAVGCRPTSPAPADWHAAQQRRDTITARWNEIRDWRREARMHVEPSATQVLAARGQSVRAAATVCPADHVPAPACEDVCGLADAICENAEVICDIAAELAPDPWANEKCDGATASCREAKQRCCGCTPPPAPAEDATSPGDADPWAQASSAEAPS